MSDMNIFLREMVLKALREDQFRHLQNDRLICYLNKRPSNRTPIHCRILVGLGKYLVTWGIALQGRFKTDTQNATI
jgi:hypothetical protein